LFTVSAQPKDFSYAPITQYGTLWQSKAYPSFSRLLDGYYAQREQDERMRQRTSALRKTAQNLLERTCRKLEAQKQELATATDRETLRQYGDLLTANLHRMTRGQSSISVENFYDPQMAPVTIPLSVTLSPQQNAARYYKQYQKAKTAEKILTEQILLATREKEYLGSILEELSRAENEKDVLEIRQELTDGGYLRSTEKKRMKLPPSRPREFISTDGFTILVGRNNRQNDELTLKIADKHDLWFHVQKLCGSHVILRCAGSEPTDTAITEAAMLAAYYSEAKESGQVAVDMVEAKKVKKPAGGKPGMVIYEN
jgi:predicted ribosome quality control (RQC) complex YloA/Tae2 family protein